AINITPKDYLDFIGRLNNLGNKLTHRYKYIGKIKNLKEAIFIVVNITPKDYSDFIAILNNLKTKLSYRYKYIKKIEDLKEAILIV
ncbi:hypothetical protein V2W45_1240284, partial [Cenococcum geophilum]